MKSFAVFFVICAVQLGCSNSARQPASTNDESVPPKVNNVASGSSDALKISESQPVPRDSVPSDAGTVYPEKNEVLAILHRARELKQKSQFQPAMELVTQALAVDPHSPAATSMERELAEILKRLKAQENKNRPGPASRTA